MKKTVELVQEAKDAMDFGYQSLLEALKADSASLNREPVEYIKKLHEIANKLYMLKTAL